MLSSDRVTNVALEAFAVSSISIASYINGVLAIIDNVAIAVDLNNSYVLGYKVRGGTIDYENGCIRNKIRDRAVCLCDKVLYILYLQIKIMQKSLCKRCKK
jgi:hypothetical protein